jgi:hypothetical protein
MGANMRRTIRNSGPVDWPRLREEGEWILNAIAGSIATGRLPPDDAFAWARIAAGEVKMLRSPASMPHGANHEARVP